MPLQNVVRAKTEREKSTRVMLNSVQETYTAAHLHTHTHSRDMTQKYEEKMNRRTNWALHKSQ